MNSLKELGTQSGEAISLEKLFISCNQLTTKELTETFSALSLPRLRKLTLFGNYIEDIEPVVKAIS